MSEKHVCPLEDPEPLGGPVTGYAINVAKGVLDLTIGVAAILVNAFILCAVLPGLVRRSRGRASKMLVIHLASADALGGVAQLFYHVTQNVCPLAHWVAQQQSLCVAKSLSVVFPSMLSINTLGAIGYDRYLCIVHSLRYQHLMTVRRAGWTIAWVWGVSGAACLSLAMSNRWRPPESACVEATVIPQWLLLAVGIPMNVTNLLIIAFTHFRIRKEVHRSQALHPLALSAPSGKAGGGGGGGGQPPHRPAPGPGGAMGRRLSGTSVKSARVLLLVVGCYMAAFMPVIIVMVLRIIGVGGEKELELAFRFSYSLAILNYVVNPFTYAWKNAPLKADMTALWARCRGRPTSAWSRRPSAAALPL